MDCPGTQDKENLSWHEFILKQIVDDGVSIDSDKYIVYSASANQMKKRQVCLMQETFFNKNKTRLMCGLSLDVINVKGGCNTGKYLAYTSLIFSKSMKTPLGVEIGEVLVLPEFKTDVTEKVNYLDMESLTIEEREMPVPVNHMDGAGMFLPDVFQQSCQIRGGWIKGAIFPFDFRQFIIEMQERGIAKDTIRDAWGNEVSVNDIRDKIKVILNDSQLKMRKYYESWVEYKNAFTDNKLEIYINNTMHYPADDDPIVLSAYQFYQTIPRENVTDDKIKALSALTIQKINDAKVNPDTALEIMGVDIEEEEELEPFYASIKAYPQMLQDPYVRKRINKKIQSERKKAMSGRPYIRGYYNYICPDLYAACEYWFCGIDKPEGLIPKNHVYNALYAKKDDVKEVCCLRSPHLSDCEHGIRLLEKSEECKRWFHGLDTVISTHDLLTYTLVCDVDGDEMLLTPDKAFIDLLDRNKLPLYYEMKKSEPIEVNKKNIFDCLMRSFKNESIGNISNSLTKYLNMAFDVDYGFVRIMTAYNNFCIDNPKSQYMPSLGQYRNMYCEWMEREYPYFFKYAKDKNTEKCCTDEKINKRSNVNRISKYIEGQTKNNKGNIWMLEAEKSDDNDKKFSPRYFQDFEAKKVDRSSAMYKEIWDELNKLKLDDSEDFRERLRKKYEANNKKFGYDVYYFYCNSVIQKIVRDNYDITERIGYRRMATLYLLDIEYFQEENAESNKDILWNCFGDILYENLIYNLEHKPHKLFTIKRNAYKKSEQLQNEIISLGEKVKEESSKERQVPIMNYEYDWISQLPCRKGCERDRYLLYLLLVQHKLRQKYLNGLENKDSICKDSYRYFLIYKHSKYGKVTRATLDKWLGGTIAKKGLDRFVKKGLIKIQECKKYDKIYLNLPEPIEEAEELFFASENNPMIEYYIYSREAKVKKCVICGKSFVVLGGNNKTCSAECSRKNELRKKNNVIQ